MFGEFESLGVSQDGVAVDDLPDPSICVTRSDCGWMDTNSVSRLSPSLNYQNLDTTDELVKVVHLKTKEETSLLLK